MPEVEWTGKGIERMWEAEIEPKGEGAYPVGVVLEIV
jgi:hypothetical protein